MGNLYMFTVCMCVKYDHLALVDFCFDLVLLVFMLRLLPLLFVLLLCVTCGGRDLGLPNK